MPKPIDLTGRRVGKLRVEEISPPGTHPTGLRMWRCRCDCGRLIDVLTHDLTRPRVTACEICEPPRRPRKSLRPCVVCQTPFAAGVNGLVCSPECREARRRGVAAGVESLPPVVRSCRICGTIFRVTRGCVKTCSAECLREKRRLKALESYYRRTAADPEMCRRNGRRRKERAAADPAYAELVRQWERQKNERHRLRMRTDPAYAAKHRAETNALYARNAERIQAERRARLDALSPEAMAEWVERARRYCRIWRRKFRDELKTDPAACQKYRDLEREYRTRRNARAAVTQAAQLAAELEKRTRETENRSGRDGG